MIMNIFVLDTDPAIAASYHCDQHLHKMKHAQWLDTRAPMSYKNRPIPPFMADLFV